MYKEIVFHVKEVYLQEENAKSVCKGIRLCYFTFENDNSDFHSLSLLYINGPARFTTYPPGVGQGIIGT